MYDPLTSTFSFPCPYGEDARVPLSSFRSLERLPGAQHPSVFHVQFACACGGEHPGLVSHDELDCAPLGASAGTTFRNLMTSRDDPLGSELVSLAATRIGAGEWPWSFFCCPEERPRPITPSAFAAIAPGFAPRAESPSGDSARATDVTMGDDALGVAVRCPSCSAVSVNIVTRAHVDVPFWNDARVGVVGELSCGDTPRAPTALLSDLRVARVDERRLDL